MLPSEMRAFLLAQHVVIRQLATRMLAAAAQAAHDPPSELGEVRTALALFGDAITTHNHDEQRLLEQVLPAADAWGAVRCASMDDHHRREHASLRRALHGVVALVDPSALSARLEALVAELFSHMEVEERVLLHANVLRDDTIAIDGFAG